MVGLIERPEHITTQWFKDEGDAIILLGAAVDMKDPLQGLGGSAFLQRLHGLKTGTPPRCDLEHECNLHLALRALIHAGGVKSAHDCSEGGLAVALAECCISNGDALVGARIDLSRFSGRLDALLFGETHSRVVVSCTSEHVAHIQRGPIPVTILGECGGPALKIETSRDTLSWETSRLREIWWNSLARLMER